MSVKFEKGDLVWAKLHGYPYWPAQIVNPSAEALEEAPKKAAHWVYFFGSENYSWIVIDKIKPFHENRDKYSLAAKSASFKQALVKIEDFIAKKEEDPTYEIVMPVAVEEKEGDGVQTPKKPKKPVKRLSKAAASAAKSPNFSAKKPRRSSPKFEENGSHFALAEELAEQVPSGNHRNSPPPLDFNNLDDNDKTQTPSSLVLGFMGLGVMGSGIVKNLINSGHRINLWNRSLDKCEKMKKNYKSGLIRVYETPCDVVFNSDVIFSCVSDSNAAHKILFGNLGVLSVEKSFEGKGYIEMTGIGPDTSIDFSKAIQKQGGRYLEAQLQGSRAEAEDGNLVVLTAGDHALFEKCQSCFKAMGKTAFYLGNVGYAAKMNMVINLINSISMVGLSEAFSLADRSGLSTKNVLEILNVTNMACPYLRRKADRLIEKNFQNPEHALEHMQKDIKLCLDLSNNLKQPLMMASTANEILKQARRLGYDGQDCSSVFMRSKFL